MVQRYDLIFVKGWTAIGHIVRLITKSPYSHVAIALDEWHVAETNWQFPLKVRHLEYRTDEVDIFRFRQGLTVKQKLAMDEFLHKMIRTPYDTVQSITNGIHILTGIPMVDSKSRMNCSETVDRMFAAAGIDLMPRQRVGEVTPGDLSRSPLLWRVK